MALLPSGGCDVRDEAVRNAAGTGIWPGPPGGGPQTADDTTHVEYLEGYEAALRRATSEGRPLLLVFGAAWCPWSGELARGPLADPDLVARTRRFVCVFVDADRDPDTCTAFGVAAFPTVVVIDADGRERFRASGSVRSGDLGAALEAVPAPGAVRRRLAADEPDVIPR